MNNVTVIIIFIFISALYIYYDIPDYSPNQEMKINGSYLLSCPDSANRRQAIQNLKGKFRCEIINTYNLDDRKKITSMMHNKGYINEQFSWTTWKKQTEPLIWLAHILAWEKIAKLQNCNSNSTGYYIIFEDDIERVRITQNDTLPKADIIWLGTCGDWPRKTIQSQRSSHTFQKLLYTACTHAYAITPKTAQALLNHVKQTKIKQNIAVDHWMTKTVLIMRLNALTFRPSVAEQNWT